MKRIYLHVFLLIGIFSALLSNAQAQTSFRFGISGSYLWGATTHLYLPVTPEVDRRVNLGFDYYPDRDRFSPQTYTLGLGLDGLQTFQVSGFPEDVSFYWGGGLNVAYNFTTFIYKPYWSFRAKPIVGVALDIGPTLFLELSPEVDFSPYFNVTTLNATPKIRLGIILFSF